MSHAPVGVDTNQNPRSAVASHNRPTRNERRQNSSATPTPKTARISSGDDSRQVSLRNATRRFIEFGGIGKGRTV
jgi:hypothetical protein